MQRTLLQETADKVAVHGMVVPKGTLGENFSRAYLSEPHPVKSDTTFLDNFYRKGFLFFCIRGIIA